MIADADEDERFLLQTAFKHKAYTGRIEFVGDSKEIMDSLRLCKAENFSDLILIDLDLPCNKSIEALRMIKQSDLLKRIPVIMFSAPKGEKHFEHCYDLGANTCIVKASTFEKLLNVVQQVYSYWAYAATTV